MQKFLLLRNNKQTGPYSVEELEQMGLKPYDLIWVNGKSAAWRYPGEIDDLKSFAPPVEEQPYDRFYKKPNEDSQKKKESAKVDSLNEAPLHPNGTGNGNGSGNGNSSSGLSFTPAVTPPSQKKEKEYKRVFVTLPNAPYYKKSAAVDEPPVQQQVPSPVQQKFAEPIPEKAIEPTPAVSEQQKPQRVEAIVNEKNGRASIDIYYTRRPSFYSRKSFLISAFALGILSLVALGMFIGLSLQKPTRDAGKQETERVYRVSEKENKKPVTDSNQNQNAALTGQSVKNPSLGSDSATLATSVRKKNTNSSSLKSQIKDLQQKGAVKPIDSSLLSIAPVKSEPEKKVTEKKTPNLGKLVSVSSNDFQVGPFGGISKLELTVHNSSEYELDLVIVELEYLKVNKEVFKTETLYFKDVGANSSVTVTAPKSNRGNKINYKISLITAKDKLFHASSD